MPRRLLLAPLVLIACAGSTPDPTGETSADTEPADTELEDTEDTEPEDTAEETCVIRPTDEEAACWHTYGGWYADGACSGSYQCCDGSWGSQGTCGSCACTEATGQQGCVPASLGDEDCFPVFEATIEPLPDSLRTAMTGESWEPGCPVGLEDLRRITMTHRGFDGQVHEGQMVVAAAVAEEVRDIFEHAYDMGFPIERMEPVHLYGGDDDASMAANNTSAFNCRKVTGGSSWSQHSYGGAIDINPVQNPYVSGGTVLPPAGAAYTDRSSYQQGMILSPGPMAGPFLVREWDWGGQWSSLKDYQHFSESGG